MKEWGKYLLWKGKGRLRSGWIPLALWLMLDLVVAALPQDMCTHISYEYPNLTHLINWLFVLSAFLLGFYPVFVLGASWFTSRRDMEKLTGVSEEGQILAGLALNVPSVLLLYAQSEVGSSLMQKFNREGVVYFQMAFGAASGVLVAFIELMFTMPCLYLFFYLLLGRRGWKLLSYVAAWVLTDLLNAWVLYPASPLAAAEVLPALVHILLCAALVPACAHIARKRGY